MKRKFLAAVLVLMSLIGSCAAAQGQLFPITDPRGESDSAYQVIPGTVMIKERFDGLKHIEGRVLIRNTLTHPVNYDRYGYLVGYSPSTEEYVVIDGCVARPSNVAVDGYSLLTYSGSAEMNLHDDWVFYPYFSLADATALPVFIGVGDAAIEPYEGSEALRLYRMLDDLPRETYQCILVLGDENHRFLWAEDVTINTELAQKAYAGIEADEVLLFRSSGREPAFAEIIVQKK